MAKIDSTEQMNYALIIANLLYTCFAFFSVRTSNKIYYNMHLVAL